MAEQPKDFIAKKKQPEEFGSEYYTTGTPTPTEQQPQAKSSSKSSKDKTKLPKPSGTGTFGAGATKGIENLINAQAPPTEQQDINKILQPYVNELMQLGPEYQQEMNYLAPYLSPEHQTFNQLVQSSKADETPTGSAAVNAADQGVANAIENPAVKPGFGSEAAAAKQYEKTIPSQAGITAGLGYQKYLQTYGGQQPVTTGWSPQSIAAYNTVMNTNLSGGAAPTSSSGLPPPTAAAGSPGLPNPTTTDLSGGSNTG